MRRAGERSSSIVRRLVDRCRQRRAPFHWFQKMNVPSFVPVMISGAPSLFRSTAATCEPTPDRLCTSSGTNSAPPGALGLRTVR